MTAARLFVWIYSHKLDSTYLPICKAGCTSITAAMLLHERVLDVLPDTTAEVHALLWYPMGQHNAVLIHGMAARVRRDTAKTPPRMFTFVRHPLARLASCYRDKVMGDRPWLASHLKVQPFGEFVRRVCDEDPATLDLHLRPQSLILDGTQPEFVGKVERMADDWRDLAERMGWDETPELMRINATGCESWAADYDDEAFDMAERYYRADLEQFDYAV